MLEHLFEIKAEKQKNDYGRFIIDPLKQGFGSTLGNSLRRVLLSSLRGIAVTQIKIQGVRHRFSTLEGLNEDIVDLILNLKQIHFKGEIKKPVKLSLEKTGPGEVKAGDIKSASGVEIVNPDLVLGKLADKKSKLKMDLIIQSGYGYLLAEEETGGEIDLINLDASFSPITRVNYKVEETRVGRQADFDKLVLEIFTDGTVKPREAMKQAAEILGDYFKQVVNPKKETKAAPEKKPESNGDLKLTLEEINLPTRVTNALRKGGYGTVEDLTGAAIGDLRQVKNLGEKSIKLVEKVLKKKDLSLKEG